MSKRASEVTHWRLERELPRQSRWGEGGEQRTRVTVDLELPADQPATTTEDQWPATHWSLAARARVPGTDLKVEFPLPVFKHANGQPADERFTV